MHHLVCWWWQVSVQSAADEQPPACTAISKGFLLQMSAACLPLMCGQKVAALMSQASVINRTPGIWH